MVVERDSEGVSVVRLRKLLFQHCLELMVHFSAFLQRPLYFLSDDHHISLRHASVQLPLVGVVVPPVHLLAGLAELLAHLVPVELVAL